MTYILGVDGGNTKTIALVARMDGTVVGAGRGGCGDIYGAAGPAGAIAEIERAVLAALVRTRVRWQPARSAWPAPIGRRISRCSRASYAGWALGARSWW